MTAPAIDVTAWRERMAVLQSAEVTAAVVVQCDQAWLQPHFATLRNEIDHGLMVAQLRRRDRITITRILLHSLPLATDAPARPAAVDRAFDEWHHRLSAARVLLCAHNQPAPRIHRLILSNDQPTAPIPDMVELFDNGDWTNHDRAGLALNIVNTAGATTPLTGYDMNLDGPFGDADPSVYM
ncbi:hypothetical protein [Streptomyces sp. NPDC006012]|uniref:hypothetical protein n=1 Tax=Streptomyces sp. NPDC006012 TaxID=3364739 RepID=UPI003683CEA4